MAWPGWQFSDRDDKSIARVFQEYREVALRTLDTLGRLPPHFVNLRRLRGSNNLRFSNYRN